MHAGAERVDDEPQPEQSTMWMVAGRSNRRGQVPTALAEMMIAASHERPCTRSQGHNKCHSSAEPQAKALRANTNDTY